MTTRGKSHPYRARGSSFPAHPCERTLLASSCGSSREVNVVQPRFHSLRRNTSVHPKNRRADEQFPRGQLTCSPSTPRIFARTTGMEVCTTVGPDCNTDQKSWRRRVSRLAHGDLLSAFIRCDMRNGKDRHSSLAPSPQGYEHLPYFGYNFTY
jgi:hypothetical protein